MSEIADRFRRSADALTTVVAAVPADAWERPSPCAGWTARDVVAHLVEWIPGPGFLLGTFGIETGPIPAVDDDPLAAWVTVRDAVQRGLDDPAIATLVADCGPPGALSFAAAVEMTCLPDVVIHAWDIAVATGVDPGLDEDEVAHQAASTDTVPAEIDDAMRASGHFGPRVEVAPDADALTRLLAFFGRRNG